MAADWKPWATEAAMVADFTGWVRHQGWQVYAETGGWDLVLVRPEDGFQIGVEAKLKLNAAVLCQAIWHDSKWDPGHGPDCWAVLAPGEKTLSGLAALATRLGVVVIKGSAPSAREYGTARMHYGGKRGWRGPVFSPDLPVRRDDAFLLADDPEWPERAPDRRVHLPEYIPDVTGGHSAPVKLTAWKIGALKIAVLLEVRGCVTRADFKHIGIDPRRWTDGWLRSAGGGRWVPNRMPDFKAQHPVNYEEIKADIERWKPPEPAQLVIGDAA